MRTTVARLTLVSTVSLMLISLMFTGRISAQITVAPDAVVGLWLFDEGAGNVAKDSSLNGLDGEVLGEAFEWVQGPFGTALQLPGDKEPAESYVMVPHDDSMNLTTWSITAWVKLEEPPAHPSYAVSKVICKGDSHPACIGLSVGPDGFASTSYTGAGGAWANGAVGVTEIYDNQWRHIASTFDENKTLRIYVDGVEEGSTENELEPVFDATFPLEIGAGTTGNGPGQYPAKGIIDEVGLFNRALTADEIMTASAKGLIISAISPLGKLATSWGAIKAQ